ncbi:MAG: YqcC family protein [Cellvibrio sp.]|uniref:YqcC family protein n=1 Tax=Cellvibrio sp. TaxID=1965322 RepID=UPI0031AC7DDA
MNNIQVTAAEILMDIEKELRELQLWDADMISEEALASEQPFAVDTMTFPQWLQFIFLPRLYFMIEQQLQLPNNCGVAPMAEQYFSVLNLNSSPLIGHLRRIDRLLTEQ